MTQNSTSTTPATVPPIITINGDNPSIIHVGDSYADLGATISDTGPGQAGNTNLGLKTFLNGTLVSNIVLDTSQVATDTIDYVATDQNGLTSTSTRTVIIEPSAHTSFLEMFPLGGSPMIRPLLIIQIPNASNKRGVAPTFRPIDRLSLRFEGGEHVIRMVFDDIIVDMAPLGAALGPRFNVNVRHAPLSLGKFCWRPKNYTKPETPVALRLPFGHYLCDKSSPSN